MPVEIRESCEPGSSSRESLSEKVAQVRELIGSDVSVTKACKRLGLSRATYYAYLKRERPRAEDDTRPMPQTNGEGECTA